MPLYRPSELKALLSEHGASPKKALSQNFLIDGNVIKKIILTADVKKGDIVLEIGPGPGALTEALLEAGASVIAVEKDNLFAKILGHFADEGNDIEVFNDDIMEFPIEEKIKKLVSQKGTKAKVIANLPYHLTTPIITRLVPLRDLFSDIIVMVQDEVAHRFTAGPGTSTYGSITVFLNYYTTPHYAFQVKKNSFYPAPKVDSAITAFTLKKPPEVLDEKAFFVMTRLAFQMRRKMLRRSLKDLYPSEAIEKALLDLELVISSRPEELSVEQFIALFDKLHRSI